MENRNEPLECACSPAKVNPKEEDSNINQGTEPELEPRTPRIFTRQFVRTVLSDAAIFFTLGFLYGLFKALSA